MENMSGISDDPDKSASAYRANIIRANISTLTTTPLPGSLPFNPLAVLRLIPLRGCSINTGKAPISKDYDHQPAAFATASLRVWLGNPGRNLSRPSNASTFKPQWTREPINLLPQTTH